MPWHVWELGEQGYIFPEQGDAIYLKNTTRIGHWSLVIGHWSFVNGKL
ncbi:hypothetical protein [Coleofasciculus sp. E2-BRE-01]